MTNLPDIINQKMNEFAPAMDALAKGEEVTKLKTVWDVAGLKSWEVVEESAKGEKMTICIHNWDFAADNSTALFTCLKCGQELYSSDALNRLNMLEDDAARLRTEGDEYRAQLAARDALIARLVEAGSDMPDERWYSICREWQAMKAGEG